MIYSAAVRVPVLCHLGAINVPTINPAIAIVHCIVTATHPCEYAIDPHTTNVPAEKKPMNNESPLIDHGIAPPAAKNDFISFPFFEKDNPAIIIPMLKKIMVIRSKSSIPSIN